MKIHVTVPEHHGQAALAWCIIWYLRAMGHQVTRYRAITKSGNWIKVYPYPEPGKEG